MEQAVSDAKPYTMENLSHPIDWTGSPASRERTIATVRALDAAQVENAALRARVAELEAAAKARADEDAETDRVIGDALPADSFTRYVSKLEEAERERDEWKARAEANAAWARGLKEDRDASEASVATLRSQRDEAAAQVERLREALENAVEASIQWVVDADANNPRSVASVAAYRNAMSASAEAQRNRAKAWEAALSEPIAPWLAERDRALAMRVAEAVFRANNRDIYRDGQSLGFYDQKDLAAIVDAALKVKL